MTSERAEFVSPYRPPMGWVDLAACSLEFDEWRAVEVKELSLRAREIPTQMLYTFAVAAYPDTVPGLSASDALTDFLAGQLDDVSFERVMATMADEDSGFELTDLGTLVTRIATLGTARPFKAVANLALNAALGWRTLRGRFMSAGIRDPINELPRLHSVLDYVEVLVTESMSSEDLEKYYFQMYAPELGNEPDGFSENDQFAAFDAFVGSMGMSG